MTEKAGIIQELGEQALLLPAMVHEALAANDRVKYYFTLLQTARDHADAPEAEAPDLRREREACGVGDPSFDRVPRESRTLPGGLYAVPRAGEIRGRIGACMEAMLAPLELEDAQDRAAAYRKRLEALRAAAPEISGESIPGSWIRAMTSARRQGGDSLHLLVMDLHKELNRLEADLAQETLAGARVYHLDDADRPPVEAFMAGLRRTAPLKFDHPGLDTTATRTGGKLVIQNDIGTTDAHVLVIHVSGLTARVTYTDVHVQRAEFFQRLFDGRGVAWEDLRARRTADLEESDSYFLCVGEHRAESRDELERFLGFLGSRLVFLIDWNKARKRLAHFVKKRDAVSLLRWAAEQELGHRAFLEMGGERLVFQAIEEAAKAAPRYGERLDESLGREAALEYLRFVLRTASEGLRQGRSSRLIRDQIKTELVRYFETAQEHLLGLAARHAALIFDIASTVRDALLEAPFGEAGDRLERTARRAKEWEKRADELVLETRALIRRSPGSEAYSAVIEAADDAADGLEECAYFLSLLPPEPGTRELFEPLQDLAALLVAGSQELVKCLESARPIGRGGARADVEDFLAAVDRLVTLEQQTDEASRGVTASALAGARDFRQLHLWSEMARALEEAADCLARCSLLLREHVLREVMVG
jgi:uncharacterized protein Yka (UPF0111/DUF47 family)